MAAVGSPPAPPCSSSAIRSSAPMLICTTWLSDPMMSTAGPTGPARVRRGGDAGQHPGPHPLGERRRERGEEVDVGLVEGTLLGPPEQRHRPPGPGAVAEDHPRLVVEAEVRTHEVAHPAGPLDVATRHERGRPAAGDGRRDQLGERGLLDGAVLDQAELVVVRVDLAAGRRTCGRRSAGACSGRASPGRRCPTAPHGRPTRRPPRGRSRGPGRPAPPPRRRDAPARR